MEVREGYNYFCAFLKLALLQVEMLVLVITMRTYLSTETVTTGRRWNGRYHHAVSRVKYGDFKGYCKIRSIRYIIVL